MSRLIKLFPLFLYFTLSAQTGGDAVYKFLNLPNSARISALGGNMIATKDDDINLCILNPSLLDSTMNNKLALSYGNYIAGIGYGYSSFAHTFKKIGTFNLGIQYLDYGDIQEADATGQKLGTFRPSDYAFIAGYGRAIDSMFSVGGNFKFIYSHLEQYISTGIAIDLAGTYYNKKRNFCLAANIRNFGTQLKPYRENNKEPLPFQVDIGGSFKPKHVPFRFNLTWQHLQKWDLTYNDPTDPVSTTDPLTGKVTTKSNFKVQGDKIMRHIVVGGELMLSKNFNIRIGYNYLRRQELLVDTKKGFSGFSWGFGFRVYKFHLSYARSSYHVAEGTNTFTLGVNLNEFYSVK